VMLALVACVCTMFWSDPRRNSLLYKADKYLAWAYAVMLFYYSPDFLLATSVLFLYAMSIIFFQEDMPSLQLVAHLLFRYVFYWWSYSAMMPDLSEFGFVSAGYAIQVLGVVFCNTYWASFAASLFFMGHVIADV
jgi:hypothetical protein